MIMGSFSLTSVDCSAKIKMPGGIPFPSSVPLIHFHPHENCVNHEVHVEINGYLACSDLSILPNSHFGCCPFARILSIARISNRFSYTSRRRIFIKSRLRRRWTQNLDRTISAFQSGKQLLVISTSQLRH